jgi:hypothetical protein
MQFYDAKRKGYVDFAITDVLQMMGRAGRPGYDVKGIACIFVADAKKSFYKKFLHSPFPVESSLHKCLYDHINAEISACTIKNKQDVLDYISWTFFFRRLRKNPSYYGLESTKREHVDLYLSQLVDKVVDSLVISGCIKVEKSNLFRTKMGEISSKYYIQHGTMEHFHHSIVQDVSITMSGILDTLCLVQEFSEIPVRHNEDLLNQNLGKLAPYSVSHYPAWDSPHLKANLLLQAHLGHLPLPIVDYKTDTNTVLDSSLRILQAMIDVSLDKNLPDAVLAYIRFIQSIKQGQFIYDDNLGQLPDGVEAPSHVDCIAQLFTCAEKDLHPDLLQYVANLPLVDVKWTYLSNDSALQLHVKRRSAFPRHFKNSETKVHCPRFTKTQYESWFAIVVLPTDGPIGDDRTTSKSPYRVELRRFSFRDRAQVSIVIPQVQAGGGKLYIMNDCYMGLDQVFDLGEYKCGL